MNILKTGGVNEEDAKKMDALEALLAQQPCFAPSQNSDYTYVGEEIASLFLDGEFENGVRELQRLEIDPEEFFSFAVYHYEEEEDIEMFDDTFILKVMDAYRA